MAHQSVKRKRRSSASSDNAYSDHVIGDFLSHRMAEHQKQAGYGAWTEATESNEQQKPLRTYLTSFAQSRRATSLPASPSAHIETRDDSHLEKTSATAKRSFRRFMSVSPKPMSPRIYPWERDRFGHDAETVVDHQAIVDERRNSTITGQGRIASREAKTQSSCFDGYQKRTIGLVNRLVDAHTQWLQPESFASWYLQPNQEATRSQAASSSILTINEGAHQPSRVPNVNTVGPAPSLMLSRNIPNQQAPGIPSFDSFSLPVKAKFRRMRSHAMQMEMTTTVNTDVRSVPFSSCGGSTVTSTNFLAALKALAADLELKHPDNVSLVDGADLVTSQFSLGIGFMGDRTRCFSVEWTRECLLEMIAVDKFGGRFFGGRSLLEIECDMQHHGRRFNGFIGLELIGFRPDVSMKMNGLSQEETAQLINSDWEAAQVKGKAEAVAEKYMSIDEAGRTCSF